MHGPWFLKSFQPGSGSVGLGEGAEEEDRGGFRRNEVTPRHGRYDSMSPGRQTSRVDTYTGVPSSSLTRSTTSRTGTSPSGRRVVEGRTVTRGTFSSCVSVCTSEPSDLSHMSRLYLYLSRCTCVCLCPVRHCLTRVSRSGVRSRRRSGHRRGRRC